MLALFALFAVTLAVVAPLVDTMTRHPAPRPDLYLAAAAATPAAAELALSRAPIETPRLFSVPFLTLDFAGQAAHLTLPDLLALLSSAVLLVRFIAWALAPLWRAKREGE